MKFKTRTIGNAQFGFATQILADGVIVAHVPAKMNSYRRGQALKWARAAFEGCDVRALIANGQAESCQTRAVDSF